MLTQLGGTSATMVHPIVQHEAIRALTPELDGDLVKSARSHMLQVPFCLFPYFLGESEWLVGLVSVGRFTRKLGDHDTFLHFRHSVEIDTIVNEGELTGIQHLGLEGHAHVSLTEARVDFFPV